MFQSFAGSLDLATLRFQGADAATQLWESFLARYPHSVLILRPLTLYRLGWSYRSTGVSGLPRTSDGSFDELGGCERASELTWKRDWPLLAVGVGGLIVLSFDYTSSFEDAAHGVVRFNERAERKFESEHPDAP